MVSKPMGNDELNKKAIEDFAKGAESKITVQDNPDSKPWDKYDPRGKRTGKEGTPFMIYLNKYEVELFKAALDEDGGSQANFIRVAALKKAKEILGV